MNKTLSKLGLCAVIVIGSVGQQALAQEIVHEGVKPPAVISPVAPATTTITLPRTPEGHVFLVRALTITNNDKAASVAISILKDHVAVTGGINVAANGTQQILFPAGFALEPNSVVDVSFGLAPPETANVDLTFDVSLPNG